jgi:hypothetical protein
VRLEVQGDAGIAGELAPAFDQGHAFGHGVRPHVGLQVQVIGAELGHVRQDRPQLLDAARIALRLPAQARGAELSRHLANVVAVEEAHACAVEAGGMDHVQLLVERPLEPVGATPLHRPQRLVDEQPLHRPRL